MNQKAVAATAMPGGGPGDVRSSALAQKQRDVEAGASADPAANCSYPGVPRIMYTPHPFRIAQEADYVGMYFEYGHHIRLIYTNGVPHYEEILTWMGDARDHWEGETFVVVSKNFNGETWFDRAGNFHSDELELVERFTRTSPDHMQYEVTVTDAKVFTQPWRIGMPLYRRVEPNARLLEYECFALENFDGGSVGHLRK